MMSSLPPLQYREVAGEPFAVGNGRERRFPLRYRGYRTQQLSLSVVYREDWQGCVRLLDTPRRNWLYPSDVSTRWGFNGASRVQITTGLMDPAGTDTARRMTCLVAGASTGPYYPGTLSALVEGHVYAFEVWLRGVHGGEVMRFGMEGGAAPLLQVTLTPDWQRVRYVGTYRKNATFIAYLVDHAEGDAIEYAFAGLYLADQVGSVIPTTTGPATTVDYQMQAPATVVLADVLAAQAHLYWDGHIYWNVYPSLLPPNATALEQAIASTAGRISEIPVALTDLWHPQRCPEPWLAWGLSVDTWSPAWPLHIRRARVASAIPIQQIKGTAKSVRDVVESFGGNVDIVEWWQETPPAPPHTFTLTVTLSGQGDAGRSSTFVDEVIDEVNRTKPVRSHFTFIQGIECFGHVGTAASLRPCVLSRLQLETLSWP